MKDVGEIGDAVEIRGYVTQDKFLVGRTMAQVEAILGFRAGRLARGAAFAKLLAWPRIDQFELAAYSMTAQHRYAAPAGLDLGKLKALAMRGWSLAGPDRLVKVRPVVPHAAAMADDDQYPPGSGAPQWRLTEAVPGLVVARTHTQADVYRPGL